ncbi:bifunctional UDP-sugar hydrolase/5'-nucleotidase [Actinomycetaceae bacterium L2_0104]
MSDARRHRRRSVGAGAAFTLAATGFVALPAGAVTNDDGTVTIDIAAISDFHGHIENAPQLDNMIKEVEAANPGDTIFAANGDLVGGSAFISAIDQDNPTMEILDAMGLQVSSVGNHEYDKGYDDLVNRIAQQVSWPYLVSNVTPADPPLAPYSVVTTESDVTVAFVGAVTDELPTLVSPDGIAGLTIDDPIATVDAQAALLKDGDPSNGEADIVVALIHETAGISKNVGGDIDAVVAGHTHHEVDETTASGAPVIEPGDFGTAYGHFKLTYNKELGEVVASEADVVTVPTMYCADDPAWTLEDETKRPTPGQLVTNDVVCPLLKDAQDKAAVLGAEPVGTIVGGADTGTNNGSDLGANRGTEMTGGNMIAQAFYQYSQSMSRPADFGIMNPGGVRAAIDPNRDGTITYQESFTAQPFGNDYGIVDISAAQVYTMLEQQWADASTQTSRPMLQLGISDSLTYTYQVDAPFGSHIKQVFLDGELLDRNDTETLYTVASNSFLLAGGDGFNVFKDGVNYLATGIIDNDVFNDFLGANPGYVVDYAQRNIAITGEDAIYPGYDATIDLASLSMTYATEQQPLPTTVELLLDGTKVGEAAIDNTVTPNLNHTGKASVTFAVPAETTLGDHELTIVAGPTEMTIPVSATEAVEATPVAPSIAENVVTIPEVEGVVYTVDGQAVTGTIALTAENPTVEIVARADAGYVLTPDSETAWTFAFDDGKASPVEGSSGNVFFGKSWSSSLTNFVMTVDDAEQFLVGDFNGDGVDTLVLRTGNSYTFLDRNRVGTTSTTLELGPVDGLPVVGDFDGDGFDDLAIRDAKSNAFSIYSNDEGNLATEATATVRYGRTDDVPVAGDWNGDTKDTLGVRRANAFHLRNTLTGGGADVAFTYGRSGDVAVVGDFNGDKKDTIAIVRGNVFHLRNTLGGGYADKALSFGRVQDIQIAGDWFGQGTDTAAVIR